MGLKVGRQNYTYTTSGNTVAGENVYAILQAPRGDATEAIVLVAAWRNVKGEFNRNGLAVALALTRYFKRWSLWSKDIILVVPPDSRAGTQAWVDAYHDSHDSRLVADLPIKSGALQGALAIDYPQEERFEGVHIVYDGVNGQLPNLDLINSVTNIASGQMGMGSSIQHMFHHNDQYRDRLTCMLRGMVNQGLGHAVGPHSSFIPYHVDAITIQPVGQGWHDEMGLGRLVEGTFRSLNNLLEHLHQSFFFYLLMQKERFVSIGTYLPSAMLIAANFTITAIALWVKTGYAPKAADTAKESKYVKETKGADAKKAEQTAEEAPAPVERELYLPLSLVTGCQFLGFVPLFVFNHAPASVSLSCNRSFQQALHHLSILTYQIGVGAPLCCGHYAIPGPAARAVLLPRHNVPADTPTIPAHHLLLPAAARHVPVDAGDAQLQFSVSGRPARDPAHLCPALSQGASGGVRLLGAAERAEPGRRGPGRRRRGDDAARS